MFWLILFIIALLLWGHGETKKQEKERELFKAAFLKQLEMHKFSLARKRWQLVRKDDYGVEHLENWQKEKEYFFARVLRKDPEFESSYLKVAAFMPKIKDDIDYNIENAAIQTLPELNILTEDVEALSPLEFENYCAEIMRKANWDANVTKTTGDQGIDVIAIKNGVKVVLQCKKYSSPVGNKAVQEIVAGKAHEQANHAAVVTNTSFTPSAQQLATTTGVKLLHVSELSDFADTLDTGA